MEKKTQKKQNHKNIRCRRKKDGTCAYYCQVRREGASALTATFYRLTDAVNWVKVTEAALLEGRSVESYKPKKHTLSDAIEAFRKNILHLQKSPSTTEHNLKFWEGKLGSRLLTSISESEIEEIWKGLVGTSSLKTGKELSNRTINSYHETLSAVFRYAMKVCRWVERNPLSVIKKLKVNNQRQRYLSQEEYKRLLEVSEKSKSPYLLLSVLLSVATGTRKSELLGLKWNAVDLESGVIHIRDSKVGEYRNVVFKGRALEMLRAHFLKRVENSEYIFAKKKLIRNGQPVVKPYQIPRRAFKTALEKAEIQNFKWHDLRHTAASYLVSLGAHLIEVKDVLGHKNIQTTSRYTHLMSDRKVSLAEGMSQFH